MQEIHGKVVLESAEEMLMHTRVALVLVDVLNDFYEPEGASGRSGSDFTRLRSSLEPLRDLLGAVRAVGLPVFHVQNTVLPEGRSDSPAFLRFKGSAPEGYESSCIAGTWGWEFVAGFEPLVGELVVRKHRPSAFVYTDFGQMLRVAGVETVLVVGCVTEGCVQATAVDAMFRDFYTVVIEDCVATFAESLHDDGIRFLKRRVATTTADVVQAALESRRPNT